MKKPVSKLGTFLIILATVILAGVAIFTAFRLYQLRQQPVAPNVPSSQPRAQEVIPTENSCSLKFTISPTPAGCNLTCNDTTNPPISCQTGLSCYVAPTNPPLAGASGLCRNPSCTENANCLCGSATPTPTLTPTPTPTPTPTLTPTPIGTPNSCGGTCGSNSNCGSGLYCYNGYCRNTSCPSNTDCVCTGTASPSPTEASLPQSGTNWPTLMGTGVGILVILGSILLAL